MYRYTSIDVLMITKIRQLQTKNIYLVLFRFLLRKNLLILQDGQTIQGQKLPKYKEKNIKITP